MIASIDTVSRCMPRNVSEVVGPSTLDGLTGTLVVLHNVSMALRFLSHASKLAGPAVKNHLGNVAGALHHSCVPVSSVS